MESVTRTVTRFRHSKRQLEQLDIIRQRLTAVQAKIQANTLRQHFDTNVRLPFVNQIVDQNEQAFFFLADPLGLRPVAEHEELAAELTRIIDAGGAQASIYLARGMSRIRLGDFKGATADLVESHDIDTKFRPLARVLHARIVGLQGARDKASNTVKSLLKENRGNPRFLTIAARIEMDAGSSASAVRYLQQANELVPSELELKLGIAWVVSAGSGTNSKLALDLATSAVESTGYRDWNSMAALANTHGMLKRVDQASEEIEAAVKLAPPSAVALCEGWRTELTAGKVVKRDWK